MESPTSCFENKNLINVQDGVGLFFLGGVPPVPTESGPNIPAKILGGIGVSLGLGLVKLVAHAFYLRFLQEWA